MWSCVRWVIGARTPCVSRPCNSHLLHTHRHTHTHTDPITSRHHLPDRPAWPFILSWAVAEQPYTSADFWLTGREDTPTWSPFSSSTTPLSPQKPLPAPPSLVPGENTLEPKCFRAGSFLGRKGFVSGHRALLRWRVCVCVFLCVFKAGSGSWVSRDCGVFGG